MLGLRFKLGGGLPLGVLAPPPGGGLLWTEVVVGLGSAPSCLDSFTPISSILEFSKNKNNFTNYQLVKTNNYLVTTTNSLRLIFCREPCNPVDNPCSSDFYYYYFYITTRW